MKTLHKAGTAGAGALVLACTYIQPWEGLWTTAKVDTIGTGQPVTVCYGATRAEIPDLKAGQKFTKQECADLLVRGLPKYWNGIAPCIHVDLPDSAKAALISAAYNAGPSAVCKSPMIAAMNTGNVAGGCSAFRGWYVRASGRVVQGLINRRNGEADLCIEGLKNPKPKITFWQKILLFFKTILKG